MAVPFARDLTLLRATPGAHVQGRWVEGDFEEVAIEGNVQPLSGKDLQALEEGRRTRAAFVVFTETEVKPLTAASPDRIVIDGDTFEVVTVQPWGVGVIDHYRAVVSKLTEVEGAVEEPGP